MSEQRWKQAIIVGASSGMGEALVRQLVVTGCKVALVARREDKLKSLAAELNTETKSELVSVYAHDVHEIDTVPALFAHIVRDLGGVDLVIYAAGVMPRMTRDEFDITKDQEMIAVNVTGAVAWLNEAAMRFKVAKQGTIIGISSVAGDRGRTGNPVYGATKAALDTYLEALRNRIERFGAVVITVKPGPVDTPMTQGLGKMPGMIPVTEAAIAILDAARNGTRVAYIPGKWRVIMAVIRAIPSPIFKHLNV